MAFLLRAARLIFSRRALAAAVVASRAHAMSKEWYPVRVAGISMIPTLRPGDLLAVRFPRSGEPRPGQIVVATTDRRELVKRITAGPGEVAGGRLLGADEFWLEGDNPNASTDSRTHGPVARRDIMGVVRGRYWPPTRLRSFRVVRR